MNDDAWIKRLREQLPGWVVFRSGGSLVGVRWHAAPAPAGTPAHEGFRLPNRIDADTPAELRALAQERYGWNDTCESCGVLARECGHRQPEREGARRPATSTECGPNPDGGWTCQPFACDRPTECLLNVY